MPPPAQPRPRLPKPPELRPHGEQIPSAARMHVEHDRVLCTSGGNPLLIIHDLHQRVGQEEVPDDLAEQRLLAGLVEERPGVATIEGAADDRPAEAALPVRRDAIELVDALNMATHRRNRPAQLLVHEQNRFRNEHTVTQQSRKKS